MFYDPTNTIGVLMVLTLSLLGFLALIYVVNVDKKQKEKELELKYKNTIDKVPTKKLTKKEKNDEIIDTLNFMLANNIIDTKQYNQLMVKCLPFME